MADRGRSSRMLKHWHVLGGIANNLTANGTFIGAPLNLDGPWTVIRMLGEYAISIGATAPTALDNVTLGFGIGVVSTDAASAGAASVPDPFSEPEYPWLFWAAHNLFFPTTTQTNAGAGASVRRSFDIRSMRKIKPRESLIAIAEYVDIVGTPPVHLDWSITRVLVAT